MQLTIDYLQLITHDSQLKTYTMAVVLFDNLLRKALFPLTSNKAVADLRIGILTGKERWKLILHEHVYVHTESYLQDLYEAISHEEHIWIDASILPDAETVKHIKALQSGESLIDNKGLIAKRGVVDVVNPSINESENRHKQIVLQKECLRLERPWQMFLWNDKILRSDFALLTKGRTSESISHTNQTIRETDIFIEEGAEVAFATLNASSGPIYIGKGAVIMEGSFIRGPFAACEKSVVKMGAKIYGATTLGPHSTGGGEIKNAILQGYSNKAHDGYLGDSVLGEWCNLGAGTTNSNIKNTASDVKMYAYDREDWMNAGLKAGVIMGDYCRTSINTSINTGTVMGVSCNVFGEGLMPKFIPDFAWGGQSGTEYLFDKALEDIENWKKLKHNNLSAAEKKVLKHIFDGRAKK